MSKIRLWLLTTMLLGMTIASTFAFPVDLTNFDGSWNGASTLVTLEFGTGSEVDHAVFHVWRSSSNIPPDFVSSSNAQRVTLNPIVGDNACNAGTGTYAYEDSTVVPTEDVYYYYLESFDCSAGDSVFYGSTDTLNRGLPVVNPNTPPDRRLYLSLLHRDTHPLK